MVTTDMEKTGLVSVIVPVYNVERYLERCVSSLLQQTYPVLQILLINDGSTDQSGLLCETYCRKDSRITVIHQENQGLAAVRNRGIAAAEGEWITFVDSDDWVAPDYVEYLLKIVHSGVDFAACGFQKTDREFVSWPDSPKDRVWYGSHSDALRIMFYQKGLDNSAWGKLYRTQLARQETYPNGAWYEDFAITYRLLLRCRRVAVGRRRLYAYFQRSNSIMGCRFTEKRYELLDFADLMYSEICHRAPEAAKAARSRCLSAYFQILLAMPPGSENPQRERIWDFLRRNRKSVLLDPHSRFKNKAAILLSYGGEGLLYAVWTGIGSWKTGRALNR